MFFLLFLFDNNYEIISMSNGIIFSFISEIDSLERSFSFKDHFKLYLRLFMNRTYENKISDISGNQVLFKVIIHRNTSLKTYYTADEVSSILNAVDISTPVGKQDYLILSMISFLGLRISDVIDMKLSSLDFSHSLISIRQYKTSEPLVLPLIDNVKYPLLDYLKNARPDDCNLDYIFVTSTRPYRHKSELRTHHYIVKKYIKLAGINIEGRKTRFHALRHSFSTILLNEDVPLYSIKTILGHTSVETTMGYLDVDTTKLKALALEVPYVEI